MGCGASTNVQARLDYITQLEAEVQDLKAQRGEALQRITVTESEKENVAVQSIRNRNYAKNARKEQVTTVETAIVEKAYLEAQYARAKANEEAVLKELKHVKVELHFLKLQFNSAKLQHTSHVKHLERAIDELEKEKVNLSKTLMDNYEMVLYNQISKYRDLMQDLIDFLTHVVELADGMKVKQIRLDAQVEIERREDLLAAFNKVHLQEYVKEAKSFLLMDPLLKEVVEGKTKKEKTDEEIEKDKAEEAERKLEEEARRQQELEKNERDREERARIRKLAEEAPRLEKELERALENYKATKRELDDAKVFVAKLQVQLQHAKTAGGNRNVVEEMDWRIQEMDSHKTEGDVPKDKEVASKKADSPLKTEELALQPADVTMKLDRVFDEIPPNSKERANFEDLFLDDMARALGVPRHLLQIKEIREGSVIVEFTILPDLQSVDDEDEEASRSLPPPVELARILEEQLQDETSPLMTGLVTNTVLTIHSQPSSAASSMPNSARGQPKGGAHGGYDPRKIRNSVDGSTGLRQQLAEAREQRKIRDGEPTKEQKKEEEKKRIRDAKQAEKDAQALKDRLERQKRIQEEKEREMLKAQQALDRAETERLMSEAELAAGVAESESGSSLEPVSEYWWLSHQNHKLDDNMEVASRSVGDPNRHVRVYFHSTFKEFMEERMNLARHAYPELMHLCLERGVSFSPIDLFWQTVDLEEAEQPEQLHYSLEELDKCSYFLFFFGGKYGWIPRSEAMAIEAKHRAWLADARGESSYAMSLGEIIFERAVLSNMEAVQGRAFFYFRDDTFGDALADAVKGHFVEYDDDVKEKLNALKEKMRQTNMQVLEDYTQPMNAVRQAFEDLQDCIHRDFPIPSTAQEIDTMRERHVHSAMAYSRRGVYLSVEAWVNRVHSHLDTRAHVGHPLIVVAPPGCGKTAFVSNYVATYRSYLPQALWLQYYTGCNAESCNYQRLCCNVMQAIKERWSLEDEVPKRLKPHEWQREMLIWLNMAATRGRCVLILDGLDQLDNTFDHALDLRWMPRSFPAEVRTIITCSPGPALDAMLERGWPVLELGELEELEGELGEKIKGRLWYSLDDESKAEIIERYKNFRTYPDLDPVMISEILKNPMTGNMNFLLQLVDEMCILQSSGRGQDQNDYLMLLQAQDITSFYDYLLWKWETFFDNIHPNFVRRVMCLIWGSRYGIGEQEILNILCDVPRIGLLHFFKTTQYCWHWSDGLVNFSHATLRNATEYRYLPSKLEKISVHRQLAGYFRSLGLGRRRLDEEAWQWMQGESWLELLTTINNFAYFPRLYDVNDGTYHCDLRRYYKAVNAHLDAANGLLQGIQRFEALNPEPAAFFTIAQMLADFFADMGKPAEAAEMYRKMLDQPDDVINSSFAMRLRISGLRVSLAKLLRGRWDQGERDFSLLNEARNMLDLALETFGGLVLAAEDAYDTAHADKDLPQVEKDLTEKILLETRLEHADVLAILGRLCMEQGDYEGAEDYLMRGLKAFEANTHTSHPSVGIITQGLAELYYHRRVYDKAEAMARRTVQVRHLCFGWNHPQFASALLTLASVLGAIGNEYDAEALMKRQAKILAMYPDTEARAEPDPSRAVGEELEGATAWQGPGGTHGGSKGNLKTSSTYEQSTKVKVPFPIKEDEEDLGIID